MSESAAKVENATFYAFKGYSLSRKYYTSGRGNLSKTVFDPTTPSRLAQIFADNDGCWPGLNGPGETFFRIAIGDESTDHGYPLMFDPTEDTVWVLIPADASGTLTITNFTEEK